MAHIHYMLLNTYLFLLTKHTLSADLIIIERNWSTTNSFRFMYKVWSWKITIWKYFRKTFSGFDLLLAEAPRLCMYEVEYHCFSIWRNIFINLYDKFWVQVLTIKIPEWAALKTVGLPIITHSLWKMVILE